MKTIKYSAITAAVAAAALVVLALVGGCGGGGTSTGVQLYLADDPMDAQAVNLTISRVDVSRDGAGWTTVRDFTSSPITIDILDYRYDGNTSTPDNYLLADSPLTEGHYTQIRLLVTRIEIVDNQGHTHVCEINSQDQTGMKLIGEFDVAAGTKTAVLIDFNAAKSIVAMGNGAYRLHPTAKVVPMQISGSLHGVVVFNSAGQPVAAPTGAAISAYQGDTLAGSALIGADGKFGMGGLVAGSYTLKLETDGFTAPDTAATVTVGADTDVGEIAATAL